MIREVKKPLKEIVGKIIDYVDPVSNKRAFRIISIWKNPQTRELESFEISREEPDTLERESRSNIISYFYDPSATNGKIIAYIRKDPEGLPITHIRWNKYVEEPRVKVGYKKLEKILKE